MSGVLNDCDALLQAAPVRIIPNGLAARVQEALDAAAAAQEDADAANLVLADIASDGKLTPSEKPELVAKRDAIIAEQAGMEAEATGMGVTTERAAYTAAIKALTDYLASAPLAGWNTIPGSTITVAGADLRAKFNDVYTKRQTLRNAITIAAASKAVWANISGAGKPEDGATVGAPAGTLVNGVPVANITSAITNFNSSNDRNSAALAIPTIVTDGSAVDHTIRKDGGADISLEWVWAGTEGDIDGFLVYVYQSTSSFAYTFGSTPALETVYTVPANKRSFILFGSAADLYTTFGVQAYRSVDKDINSTGAIKSPLVKPSLAAENPYRPQANVAFGGDITGTVNGTAVATLLANAAAGKAASDAIAAIAADGILDRSEKAQLVTEWTAINAEWAQLRGQAAALGVPSLAYDTAREQAANYLSSLVPGWDDVSANTDINRAYFRALFSDYYSQKMALMNAISAAAATRADYINVNGRPDDPLNLLRKSVFEDGQLGGWGGSSSVVSAAGKAWTKCLRITNRDNYHADTIPVSPGEILYIEADVETLTATADVRVGFVNIKSDGSLLNWSAGVSAAKGTGWTRLSGSVTTHGSAAKIQPWLSIDATAGTAMGNAYFANLRITRFKSAAVAQAEVNALNASITAISSDNVLSKGEKAETILKWNTILSEFGPLQTQADSLAVSHVALDNAYSALYNYLASMNGGATSWTDVLVDTPIVGTTFRQRFSDYYTAKQALSNAMAAKAATTADANSITGMTHFRVLTQGNSRSTNTKPSGSDGLYRNGVHSVGAGRSYTLVAISRSTGLITFNRTFDVYGDPAQANELRNYLNVFSSDVIVVVYTYDEPYSNRTTNSLDAAMYRCGASRAIFGSPQFKDRSAYCLIGIPGSGEGNGAEFYQGDVSSDPNAWIEASFTLVNGNFTSSGGYIPRSLRDYSYTGDYNATSGAPAGTQVAGVDAATVAAGAQAGASLKTPFAVSIGGTVSANIGGKTGTVATRTASITGSANVKSVQWALLDPTGDGSLYLQNASTQTVTVRSNVGAVPSDSGAVLVCTVSGLDGRVATDSVSASVHHA